MATKSNITIELDRFHAASLILSDDKSTIVDQQWEPVDARYKTTLGEMYKIKDRWKSIHKDVKLYVPDGSSVLDLGCGDKEILNTIVTNDYWGVDLYPKADEHHDLDAELLTWDRTWDVGLIVETLSFIREPDRLLDHYKQYANSWIITTRPINPLAAVIKESRVNARHYWTRDLFRDFLYQHFDQVDVSDIIYTDIECYGSGFPKPFIIAVCTP